MINDYKKIYNASLETLNSVLTNLDIEIKEIESQGYTTCIKRDNENGLYEFKLGANRFLLQPEIQVEMNTLLFKVFYRTINLDTYPDRITFRNEHLSKYDISYEIFNNPKFIEPKTSSLRWDMPEEITQFDKRLFGRILFEQLDIWLTDRKVTSS